MSEHRILRSHTPCPNEACGSSDGVTIYEDGAHCFVCEKTFTVEEAMKMTDGIVPAAHGAKSNKYMNVTGKVRALTDRRITEETCAKYGVTTLTKEGIITKHLYPYCKNGEVVAKKIRIVATKDFTCEGHMKGCQLFGQQLFPASGKFIVVTEGEIDALSAYQMLKNKYEVPCVSLPNGASSLQAIKDNYEYLAKFENILLCLDGDKVGKVNTIKIAELLPPKQVKIMHMTEDMKDANEFLKAGKVEDFVNRFWRATAYTPDDIISAKDMLQRVLDFKKDYRFIPYPWQGLNSMLGGVTYSQLCVWLAGTGMGKSYFMKEMIKHFINVLPEGERIGALFLEEISEVTLLSMMSDILGENLLEPDILKETSEEDLTRAHEQLCGSDRFDLYDGFDMNDIEVVEKKIRYLVKARDCRMIILDHATMIIEGSDMDDKSAADALFNKLKCLCMELNIIVICAVHLRKSQSGTPHEEGGRVTLDDAKSASSIKQLANQVIAIERNQQHPDEEMKNITLFRVLKNRELGKVGPSCGLIYNPLTTKVEEVDVSVALEALEKPKKTKEV